MFFSVQIQEKCNDVQKLGKSGSRCQICGGGHTRLELKPFFCFETLLQDLADGGVTAWERPSCALPSAYVGHHTRSEQRGPLFERTDLATCPRPTCAVSVRSLGRHREWPVLAGYPPRGGRRGGYVLRAHGLGVQRRRVRWWRWLLRLRRVRRPTIIQWQGLSHGYDPTYSGDPTCARSRWLVGILDVQSRAGDGPEPKILERPTARAAGDRFRERCRFKLLRKSPLPYSDVNANELVDAGSPFLQEIVRHAGLFGDCLGVEMRWNFHLEWCAGSRSDEEDCFRLGRLDKTVQFDSS